MVTDARFLLPLTLLVSLNIASAQDQGRSSAADTRYQSPDGSWSVDLADAWYAIDKETVDDAERGFLKEIDKQKNDNPELWKLARAQSGALFDRVRSGRGVLLFPRTALAAPQRESYWVQISSLQGPVGTDPWNAFLAKMPQDLDIQYELLGTDSVTIDGVDSSHFVARMTAPGGKPMHMVVYLVPGENDATVIQALVPEPHLAAARPLVRVLAGSLRRATKPPTDYSSFFWAAILGVSCGVFAGLLSRWWKRRRQQRQQQRQQRQTTK
ncbi:MAG: hypothetical protein ACYST0_10920 [Planctomycetota bacterium]|jgi:hypothetical protein